MMSVIEFLSQPFWQRLGLTLVHFIWQGLVVAVLVGAIVRLFRPSPGNARYATYLLMFIVMMACPIVTFTAINRSSENFSALPAMEAEALELPEPISYSAVPAGGVLQKTDAPTSEFAGVAIKASSIPLHGRTYDYLHTSLPWALVGWMAGVLVLSMRLLLGIIGVHRWRRQLEPLPENLEQRVAFLSERLRMRNFPRVFISPSASQGMAVGCLRPIVLLPAVMLTQMQPEMLEAIIAHELAHIRRFDLWVNLIQRVTETLLFYHPIVRWLSNRLREECELCCDELAVNATGERLTYALALEKAGRTRLFGKKPAVAAGLGQSKPMLSRIRHILGFAPTQRNSRFWLAGVITVSILVLLNIPANLALTGRASEGSNEIKSNLLRVLADPKVGAEGQGILRRMAEVNRYWLVAPSREVENHSYDFNLYDWEINGPKLESIKVKRPPEVDSKWRQGITYDSVLHRLISDPSASIIRKIQRNQQIIQLDFVLRDFTDVTCGNGISHSWRGYFTGLAEAGSLWLDATKMVPVKLKAGWLVEHFSEYVAVDESHYVPLKITVGHNGNRYHWIFGLYDPGLWLFETAYYGEDERGQPRMVASINSLKINKQAAAKTKTIVVEVPELNDGRKVNDRKTGKQRKSVTLMLTGQGMSFEGQTVTWDQLVSLLADVPEAEVTGLELLVASDGLTPEELNDTKTRISTLSRELDFRYLSCVKSQIYGQEKSREEHFFAAPLEFNKEKYIRQNAGGGFKQKYYRGEREWHTDKIEQPREWATVRADSIHFRKTWLEGEVHGKLKVGYTSWPRAKWRFTIRLFDDKARRLAQASSELLAGGHIASGRVLDTSTTLDFSFGRWADISRAISFELLIVPLLESDFGVNPSTTPGGEMTNLSD